MCINIKHLLQVKKNDKFMNFVDLKKCLFWMPVIRHRATLWGIQAWHIHDIKSNSMSTLEGSERYNISRQSRSGVIK